jgi:hypothetical protein
LEVVALIGDDRLDAVEERRRVGHVQVPGYPDSHNAVKVSPLRSTKYTGKSSACNFIRPHRSQSYECWIYNFNTGDVIGKITLKLEENIFVFKNALSCFVSCKILHREHSISRS